jgi:hypothetical protein
MSNVIDICGYIVPKPSNDYQACSLARIAGEQLKEAEITFTNPRQEKQFHDFLQADYYFMEAVSGLHDLRGRAEYLKLQSDSVISMVDFIEKCLERSLWQMHRANNPEDAA